MEICVYQNGEEEVGNDYSRQDLTKLLAEKKNLVWVDFDIRNEADRIEADEILHNVFHFHPLAIEDAHETRNQPKLEVFANYLFFIVHGVKTETNTENFVTKELDGFLGENFLVTYHNEPFRSINKLKDHLKDSPFICTRGSEYLLHQILDELVDLYLPVVDEFDVAIDKLEERIFRLKRGNNKILEEIMDLKRAVARLRRISSKQLEVLYKMSHNESRFIDDSIQPFFRDIYDHLQRISDLSESYRDLVSGLLDIHFSVIANKTNDVMKVMAIFSAIMLPLSLIAGIYGMNFDYMPELKTRLGYFVVLGFMFLVAAGLIIYFWRKGWIGTEDLEEIPEDEDEKTKAKYLSRK